MPLKVTSGVKHIWKNEYICFVDKKNKNYESRLISMAGIINGSVFSIVLLGFFYKSLQ